MNSRIGTPSPFAIGPCVRLFGQTDIVNIINARDIENKTPLHWAADGHIDAVALLLDHGAIRSVRDDDGKTPRDHSEGAEITKLLTGADSTAQE